MSVRGGLAAAIGAGLVLTLGGGAAIAAPTVMADVREIGGPGVNAPSEICRVYQSPSNARASICSAASIPESPGEKVNGYYRGTLSGSPGQVQALVDGVTQNHVHAPDFRGIWTDATSVQFRICGDTGGCGPWK